MRGKKPEIKKNRCTQSNCGKMSDVTYSASTQAPSAQWVEILSEERAGIRMRNEGLCTKSIRAI